MRSLTLDEVPTEARGFDAAVERVLESEPVETGDCLGGLGHDGRVSAWRARGRTAERVEWFRPAQQRGARKGGATRPRTDRDVLLFVAVEREPEVGRFYPGSRKRTTGRPQSSGSPKRKE